MPYQNRRDRPTKNDYPLDEVVSAIQKACRRCDEKQVLYWVKEMCISGYGKYAFKRLRVVMTEDIGVLGNPGLVPDIQALYAVFLELYDKKHRDLGLYSFPIIAAALALARSPKDRTVCDVSTVWSEIPQAHFAQLPMPKKIEHDPLTGIAVDQYTYCADPEFEIAWEDVHCNLLDSDPSLTDPLLLPLPAPFDDFLQAFAHGDEITAISTFYHRCDDKKLAWTMMRLAAVILYPFKPQLHSQLHSLQEAWAQFDGQADQVLFHDQALLLLSRISKQEVSKEVLCAKSLFWNHVELLGQFAIPDHAKDMHTTSGKRLGRDNQHFVEHAGKLHNKVHDGLNDYEKVWHWYYCQGGEQQCKDKASGQRTLF